MIYPLFEFCGVLFWIYTILGTFFIISRFSEEGKLEGTLWTLGFVIGFLLLGDTTITVFLTSLPVCAYHRVLNLCNLVLENSVNILIFVGAYICLGAIWGLIKWFLFAHEILERYDEVKARWLRSKGVASSLEIPNEFKGEWLEYLLERNEWSEPTGQSRRDRDGNVIQGRVLKVQPIAWEHKGEIVLWMTLWPFSLLWSLFHDLLRRVFKAIQRTLSRLMDKISAFVFKDIRKDFDTPSNG